MVLKSFMEDVIDYLENHDMEKWAWDVEDLCNRIDRILRAFEEWKKTKSKDSFEWLITELEILHRNW